MGFNKYILRKGLGSPGQTARIWAKQYQLLVASGLSKEEAFEGVILKFHYGQSVVRNLAEKTPTESILDFAKGDLPTVIFCLLCDTPNFRKNAVALLGDTTEVIYEEVEKIAPRAINSDLSEFKSKALQHLGWCDAF